MREAKGGCGRPLFFPGRFFAQASVRASARVCSMACALAVLLCPAMAAAQPDPEGASGYQAKALVHAQRQMVVAAHPLATQAGLEILRAGGSAVDAAIAVQLVLGLVEPQSSGLGGGAFLLHWDPQPGEVRSYDGRETAPAAATPARFLDALGRTLPYHEAVASGRSVGVPGVLRMLELAHARHGRLPWARLFAPALQLAGEGFAVTPRLHRLLSTERFLREDPAARALYYERDGTAKAVGARIVNAEYAATLRALAAHGAAAFYAGDIARDIVRAVRAHARPGDLAESDLAAYRALERPPVCGGFREYRLCSMGPPSAGGIGVLQILGILERRGFAGLPAASEPALHLFAEAGRLAYADRARWIADPDFVPQPVEGLLAADYLEARAALVGPRSMGWARPGRPRGAQALGGDAGGEASGTSHLSIVDAGGRAVAMTTTIESQFGSRIMVRGFLLNNQLTDFSFNPESEGLPAANRVEGGKRPRSSMAPTLVFEAGGRLRMSLGSPGGPAIINYVAKTLVGTLAWGLDIQAAIALPNFGSANGPTLIERGSAWEEMGDALAERGHTLSFRPLTSGTHGIERVDGALRGGADPRREGVAGGD
jgi:gamma-glutamyltranspeptidase/glutathione hydrolase